MKLEFLSKEWIRSKKKEIGREIEFLKDNGFDNEADSLTQQIAILSEIQELRSRIRRYCLFIGYENEDFLPKEKEDITVYGERIITLFKNRATVVFDTNEFDEEVEDTKAVG